MAFSFQEFKPSTVDDFLKGLIAALKETAGSWFSSAREDIEGQLRTIAEDVIHTGMRLKKGLMTPERAKALNRVHRLAFQNTLIEMQLASFRLLQQIVDTVFKAAGWAIYNHTGINLAPALVSP